jgi:uncharacterized DUF497 family protein
LNGRDYEFEWDDVKANTNLRKQGVSFDLARTVFNDERLVTVADLEHSQTEERWFSIGFATNGTLLTVVYLWSEGPSTTKIRLISARKATQTEIRYYQEGV